MTVELHDSLRPMAALLGSWSGDGAGEYPTIEPFRYRETITFGHVGKPFLAYTQRTLALGAGGEPGLPLHAEAGYWRFPEPGRVEVVLAHPSGIIEIEEGTLTADVGSLVIELRSTSVATTSTAKSVTAVERSFRFDGDQLTYTLGMAAVGHPMTHHLAATLHRNAES
jgi:hypothetical protein